jgi:hypothetical protein
MNMKTENKTTQTTEPAIAVEPVLGSVYSPNGVDKWKVIAIDVYGRIFLETWQGSIYYYDKEAFNRSFSCMKCRRIGTTTLSTYC